MPGSSCYNNLIKTDGNQVIFLEFYGTIGPACAQPETLRQMVEAGMTGIRMNLSHGSLAEHADWLSLIRAAGAAFDPAGGRHPAAGPRRRGVPARAGRCLQTRTAASAG